jgi:UrcA family protein
MNTSTRIFVTTLALGAATLAAAGNLPDIKVQYGASDLASTAAVTALHGRLTAAAEQSCAQLEGRELARQRVYHDCIAKLLGAAVREVHNTSLAAVHEARTGEHIDVRQVAVRLAGKARSAVTNAR